MIPIVSVCQILSAHTELVDIHTICTHSIPTSGGWTNPTSGVLCFKRKKKKTQNNVEQMFISTDFSRVDNQINRITQTKIIIT